MKGITHKQAIQFIHRKLDGMLKENESLLLDEHLTTCDSCRAYANKMQSFPKQLAAEFKERWDHYQEPSDRVLQRVCAKARTIPSRRHLASGMKFATGIAAIAVLSFVMNFIILKLQSNSATIGTTNGTPSAYAEETTRLLAFTKEVEGNPDIFTIHADGSEITNLTHDPARDTSPVFSPDGKRIAFESDRTGTTQIYLMDADGSNRVQITDGQAEHTLSFLGDSRLNIWSPDGTRLLFVQTDSQTEMKNLYAIDITSRNKTLLASDTRLLDTESWSPDGNYVGYVAWDEVEPGSFTPNIFIVDANGKNVQELSELVPQKEHIFTPYFWASDRRSIVFPSTLYEENRETIYQFDPQENTLNPLMTTKPALYDWQEGVALGIDMAKDDQPFVWQRLDGTSAELKMLKGTDPVDCYVGKARGASGRLILGSSCKQDSKVSLYWTNVDGSDIHALPEVNVPSLDGGLVGLTLSPDEKFIAFNFGSKEETSLYLWDLEAVLKDPSVQPQRIIMGEATVPFVSSWQPVVPEESKLVEEAPTEGLLAFTMETNGNSDIYTMHADGSGLTNLTSDPARDVSPVWSPDGKRIAFESDRNGFRQIFLMNADGSGVVQLVPDEGDQEANQDLKGDQWIGEPYNLGLNLWSPDGKKLVFLEMAPGNENGMLYVIDANGENKKPLVTEAGNYSSPAWSPDGKHIAFIAREDSVYRIYSTDLDGNHITNVTKKLELSETLFPARYSWSPDGQSISFIASNWNYLLGGPIDPLNHTWTVYEASPDGNTLIANVSEHSQIGGYWEGTYFLPGSTTLSSSPEYTWLHSDGTITTVNPVENCGSHSDSTGFSTYKQSSNGNVVIGAYCPNGEKWLFWANSDGLFKPLLNSPLQGISDSNAMHLWAPPDFIWSSDDKHIAFNVFSRGKTEMYIVNTSDSLNNPSVQPFHMSIGNGFLYYSPVWQPVSVPEIVKEEPAPEPTPEIESKLLPPMGTNISNGEWIAFIGGTNSDTFYNPASIPLNQNIFLVHPDGSMLTNVTEFNAHYYSLQWSPNGQHLLFMRENSVTGKIDVMRHSAGSTGSSTIAKPIADPDHYGYSWSPNSDKIVFADASSGNYDIYTVYADGRNDPNLTQLTNDPAQDVGFVWSPDGSQIAFQRVNGDQLSVYVMNKDGSDPREVARGMGKVKLHWSMDGQSLYANSIYRWENTKYSHLECKGCVIQPSVYKIDLSGLSVYQIYYEEDSNRFFYVYEATQNRLYFLSMQERDASVGLWGSWRYWDGDSVREIGEIDPHQTCLTTTGDILNEHISPNPRYSIISNYCAGGFDLYLADRETSNPEKKLMHLLRLPLDTWGQGGDGATIPIMWSPDGRWLIYNDDRQNTRLLLLDLEEAIQNPDQAITTLLQQEYFTDASGQEFLLQELTVFDLEWQPRP